MILVLNSGSSSIKYKLFKSKNNKLVYEGIEEEVTDFHIAFKSIFKKLIDDKFIKNIDNIKAFGHRVVHGGEKFSKPVLIDDKVIKEIEKLIPLAPLHNPSNLEGIKISKILAPKAKQVAVFDTAFHQTIPKETYIYPIPYELYEKHSIRKYGFHGTSHHYVAKETAKYLKKPLDKLNIITIHLGNGDSITAIKNGKSIDTSMGFTPLEGLMMGTRCGDIDPEIILYLENQLGIEPKKVDTMLNKESGFKGICNNSDLRQIIKKANNKDELSLLAIKMFAYRVKKYVGAYKEVLNRVDAVVFTGGIGENSHLVRDAISYNVDKKRNKELKGLGEIQNKNAPYKILVIPTNEELEIAIQTKSLVFSSF
ncbi:MAG: acetate kinase [Campylobacterota bacterium]|nr:acetate kinase [Campylobacterota bacterium]